MEENKNRILTELPRRGKLIDCKAMVGMELELFYKGEIYTGVKVLEYIKGSKARFVIEYNGQTYNIRCGSFIRGQFGGVLRLVTKDFKVNIGDVLKDDKRDIVITDREYKKDKSGTNKKWYKYTCNKCGWTEGWIEESSLLKGQGCSCCAGRTAVLGINTIWDTDRWLCDLGVSEEDAKTHTRSSNDKVVVICPECGKKKEMKINSIYRRKTIGCSCGDGVKYPEKFMTSVLDQLGVEYQTQYQPEYLNRLEEDGKWSQKKSDFYLPNYNLIIETDGGMNHKGGKVHGYSKKSLEYYIEVDNWKDEQHLLHGLKTIRINCFESNMEYIKNSILNSELINFGDFSKVNWLKCEEFALCNLVKSVCDYWNNKEEWETTTTLAEVFGLGRNTIREYLKKGAGLG